MVVEFPKCINGDIECYRRMPRDPHLVDPKVEKVPEQCDAEDATPGAAVPMTDNQLPH